MAKINETLKGLRLERGLTQEDVAEQVGLTRQAVSGYESGRTQPGLDILERLAQVYQVEMTDIIYGRGRGLRLYRRLKITALVMAVVVLAAQLAASLLLWTANRFFAIEPGTVSQGELLVLETRMKLNDVYGFAEGFYLGLAPLFCVALLVLMLCLSRPLGAKVKVLCVLGFAAASAAVVLPWALADPVYGVANYLIGPQLVLGYLLLFLLLSLIIDFFRLRRRRRTAEVPTE